LTLLSHPNAYSDRFVDFYFGRDDSLSSEISFNMDEDISEIETQIDQNETDGKIYFFSVLHQESYNNES